MTNKEQSKKPFHIPKAGAFYIVLAVCVLASSVISLRALKTKVQIGGDTTTVSATDADAEVGKNVTGVPDDRNPANGSFTNAYSEITPTAPATAFQVSDYFGLPLGKDIGMSFSDGEMIFAKTMGDWRTHNGTDYRGAVGDPVKAVNNGKVKAVYDDALWGTVVEIDHGNGLLARYCGLGKGSTVQAGGLIKIGEKVGNLGAVPMESAENPHLHLELLRDGKFIDPAGILGKN